MNIGIIYHGDEYPPAERIDKQAKSLLERGYSVFVLCNKYNISSIHPVEGIPEEYNSVIINRVGLTARSRMLNRIIKFPIFFNPVWLVYIFLFVRRNKIDLLQVVDIPLALGVVLVSRLTGTKVVLDMWENYPEALRGWATVDWRTRVFKNFRVAKVIEWLSIRLVDRIIVVVEEQAARLTKSGILAEKVFVASNTVDLDDFCGGFAQEGEEQFLKPDLPSDSSPTIDLRLLYVGVITVERGLEDIIHAVYEMRDAYPQYYRRIKLIIAGDGNYKSHLLGLVDKLDLNSVVEFPGWVPFKEISIEIRKAYLCLVPHVNNEFINTTIPNKIFQYLAMGKPILVSNAEPLKRVAEEGRCGYVFISGEPSSALEQIIKAFEDPSGAKSKGIAGRALVVSRYNWGITKNTYLSAVENWL